MDLTYRTSAYYDAIISVVVGKGEIKREFRLHKGLLSYHSSYFQEVLNSRCAEGLYGVVHLPEDDVEVFQAFYYWLYTRKLFDLHAGRAYVSKTDTTNIGWMLICKIFVFGDARGIPGLKNAAVDLIIAKFIQTWAFPIEIVRFVFDNTQESSPLRKLLVDMALESGDLDRIRQYRGYFTKDFLVDMVVTMQKSNRAASVTSKEQWAARSPCIYHDHTKVLLFSGEVNTPGLLDL